MSLKQKTAIALYWSSTEQFIARFSTLAITIILARILSPNDYGLLGIVEVFSSIAYIFVEGGFVTALIQKDNVDNKDLSSFFFLNIALSLIIISILWIFAKSIALYFNQPIIENIIKIQSFCTLIGALGFIPFVNFNRNLNFKIFFKINIFASILSRTIAVYLAYIGFGVWSLVILKLLEASIRTTLLWIYSPWRPCFIFSFSRISSLFKFGSNIFLSNLLESSFNGIYKVTIGKLFPLNDLGYYTKAQSFSMIPSSITVSAVRPVSMAAFSRSKNNRIEQKEILQNILKMLYFILLPIMFMGILCGKDFITLLLTKKWLPMLPYFKLFCIIALFYPIHQINKQLIIANGYSGVF